MYDRFLRTMPDAHLIQAPDAGEHHALVIKAEERQLGSLHHLSKGEEGGGWYLGPKATASLLLAFHLGTTQHRDCGAS